MRSYAIDVPSGKGFVWDSDKEDVNRDKHGIDFSLASQVFNDPLAITTYDGAHSHDDEDRWTTIGLVGGMLVLVRVTWTDSDGDDVIRIISARLANAKERVRYQLGEP